MLVAVVLFSKLKNKHQPKKNIPPDQHIVALLLGILLLPYCVFFCWEAFPVVVQHKKCNTSPIAHLLRFLASSMQTQKKGVRGTHYGIWAESTKKSFVEQQQQKNFKTHFTTHQDTTNINSPFFLSNLFLPPLLCTLVLLSVWLKVHYWWWCEITMMMTGCSWTVPETQMYVLLVQCLLHLHFPLMRHSHSQTHSENNVMSQSNDNGDKKKKEEKLLTTTHHFHQTTAGRARELYILL